MASPQVEDGYTRIANELLDAMCALRLNGQQWRVLMTIIRQTYGWHQKTDWISGSQIAQMTGLHRAHVCRALKALLQARVILREGRRVGVQKDYTAWQNVTQSGNCYPIEQQKNVTQLGNTVTQSGNKMLPNQVHTKDKRNYTKDRDARAQFQKPRDADHPAIDVFAELTGKRPRKGTLQRDAIVRTVTDNPRSVQNWRDAVTAWLLCDNKPTNVNGMLDWYKSGKRDNRARTEPSKQQTDQEEADRIQRKLEQWERQNQHMLKKGGDHGQPTDV